MTEVPLVYVGNANVSRIIKTMGVKKNRRVLTNVRTKAEKLAPTFVDSSKDLPPASSTSKKNLSDKDEDTSEQKILSIAGSVELMDDHAHHPVYSFKTPKRANQMAKFAADSAQKRALLSSHHNEETVQDAEMKKRENKKNTLSSKLSDGKTPSSRYQLRIRNDSDESDSDSDDDFQSDTEEISDTTRTGNNTMKSQSRSMSSTRRHLLPSEVELYFDAHGEKTTRNATSDRTLQGLKNPRMRPDKLSEVLKEHKKIIEKADDVQAVHDYQTHLCESYEQLFTKWMFYLCNDFNLLLFGLGSKRNFIHKFCQKYLKKQDKLIVNGFFPGLSIKTILSSIIEGVMQSSIDLLNVDSQMDEIVKHFNTKEASEIIPATREMNIMLHLELFLVIHNIDGMMLRNPTAQSLLSQLGSLTKVHIVASIDHINAPLIWTQTVSCRFNWLWYDVTTYAPYDIETSYEGSLLLTGAGAGVSARGAALALSGLLHVARSLTSNARGVYRILAERQIEDKENKENEKLDDFSFFDLYQKCRERFLVNSELTLRAHLTEFVDHKLVQIRAGTDGCDYLSVPLNIETLKEYLDQEEVL